MNEIAETLARLSAIDTCALSDALDKLGMAGQVTGLRRESGAGRVAGVAVTMQVGTGDPPPGPPVHLGVRAIEAADQYSVIVIEQRSGVEAGCWGGLLTRGARHANVRGVIADGPVRDIDEARELEFPIFTNALTCYTARARVVEMATNQPVRIGPVTVHPGDYIVADATAVIVIRPADAPRVLQAAEAIYAREGAMIADMARGISLHEVLGTSYEHMLQKD